MQVDRTSNVGFGTKITPYKVVDEALTYASKRGFYHTELKSNLQKLKIDGSDNVLNVIVNDTTPVSFNIEKNGIPVVENYYVNGKADKGNLFRKLINQIAQYGLESLKK